MNKKSILNPMKRIVTVMLAVAMVFSVNLTSMTVHAAVAKPTIQTEQDKPAEIKRLQIGGNTAAIYKDDNGDQLYIRYMYPFETDPSSLENVSVSIRSTVPVTSEDVTVENSGNVYTFSTSLLNEAPKVSIGGIDYIVAAGITADQKTPESDDYVKNATINGVVATVTRMVQDNPCPGNIYYTEGTDKKIDWILVNNTISANEVGEVAEKTKTALAYTLGGNKQETTIDLSNGTKSIEIGDYTYTVQATFVEGFVATKSNFWIDFREMRKSTNPAPDDAALAAAKEIEYVVDEYYKDQSVSKSFGKGATNMQVLQSILEYGVSLGKFTRDNTTTGSDVTYVAKIDGLGEFSVGSMSGWMYTDNPDESINPENWYTAPIGAADYKMSTTSKIAWFFVVDYSTHPWQ